MYSLTPNEVKGLKALALIIFLGAVFQCVFKKYPEILNLINLTDSSYSYLKIDVNLATQEELIDIPYIGSYTAAKIIQYKNMNGPFRSIEQLKGIDGIRPENYKRFSLYLKVGSNE